MRISFGLLLAFGAALAGAPRPSGTSGYAMSVEDTARPYLGAGEQPRTQRLHLLNDLGELDFENC